MLSCDIVPRDVVLGWLGGKCLGEADTPTPPPPLTSATTPGDDVNEIAARVQGVCVR